MSIELHGGLRFYSVPPPGSGAILAFILNVMQNYGLEALDRDENEALNLHRMIEAFKYGYAQRSRLGDTADTNIREEVEQVFYMVNIDMVVRYQVG